MQQWEYMSVFVNGLPGEDSAGRKGGLVRSPGGSPGDATSILNELGKQGWELAGVVGESAHTYRLFLKRPKV